MERSEAGTGDERVAGEDKKGKGWVTRGTHASVCVKGRVEGAVGI
jgi:hypothetical protein